MALFQGKLLQKYDPTAALFFFFSSFTQKPLSNQASNKERSLREIIKEEQRRIEEGRMAEKKGWMGPFDDKKSTPATQTFLPKRSSSSTPPSSSLFLFRQASL